MRAAVISLDEMCANGYSIPAITTPTFLDQALQQKQLTHLLTHTLSQLSIDPSQPDPIHTAATAIDTALQSENAFVAQDLESPDGEIGDKIEEEGEDSETTDDELDFSTICQGSGAREALDEQKTACVFFKPDQAVPKLGQLGTVLKGAHMNSSDIPCVASFIEQPEVLTSELKHMMSETKLTPDGSANTNRTQDQLSDATPVTPLRLIKQPVGAIMGPSPEKASKRHTSYGVRSEEHTSELQSPC